MYFSSLENVLYLGKQENSFTGKDGNNVKILKYSFMEISEEEDDDETSIITFNTTNDELAKKIKKFSKVDVMLDVTNSKDGIRTKLVDISPAQA